MTREEIIGPYIRGIGNREHRGVLGIRGVVHKGHRGHRGHNWHSKHRVIRGIDVYWRGLAEGLSRGA